MASKIFVLMALVLLLVVPLSMAQYGYGSDEDKKAKPHLSVELASGCDGNVVTVTSGEDAVNNAKVTVMDMANGPIFSGNTGADGKISFTGCGLYVKVYASKNGYLSDSMSDNLIACGLCGQQTPGCTSDSQCSATQRCSGGNCVTVPCECGAVSNHQCAPYACCSDSQCGANQVCENHACKPKPEEKPPQYECTSDSGCADAKRCEIAAGAAGGTCVDVTGCGTVANHVLTPYECGDGPDCQACAAGKRCIDHTCIAVDLRGPETGFVGDDAPLTASEGGQPCADCDIVVTDPAGKKSTGRTDGNGGFTLPLNMQGTYTITLLKGGQPVKQITLQALPKATPQEEGKPSTALDGGSLLLLFGGLLVVIALGIIYWRGRGGK